ncbi:MAG: hypothetical protein LUO79_02925 [Methanomassiliicoccales archaeon]|nr:hypothetical protein [Methanomassiliicoccales archaeon]
MLAKETAGLGQPGSLHAVLGDHTRESAAEWTDLGTLKAWSDNPRKNKRAAPKVARSIRRFGWGNAILARRDDREIVAGHTRLLAVTILRTWWERERSNPKKRAKWHPEAIRVVERNEAPVRFGDWDEDEAHLLAVADNRIGEEADWDEDKLSEVLSSFDERDLSDAGFDDDEADELLTDTDDDENVGADVDEIPLTYSVIVECNDERHQAQTLEKLESQGYRVKPLAT